MSNVINGGSTEEISARSMVVADLTSNTEFDLVKRVQLTNETPSSSLAALLPTGLQNDFWKYFAGSTTVEHEVPTTGPGSSFESQVQKIVNGSPSYSYGPPTDYNDTPTGTKEFLQRNPSSYHSLNVDGVIQPELDLFLHELYRYLDPLYPDHPDYDQLLTPIEINDAFFAAAAIVGYEPDYKFLSSWSQSISGYALTQEELKWKIRDLRNAAFRRKFAGSYSGYKNIFSSMYRLGAVYTTAEYLPKTSMNALDTTSGNLFRLFRLIDFLGENDKTYQTNPLITFKGIIDPSELFSIYEASQYSVLGDTSEVVNIALGSFINDRNQVFIPSPLESQSGVTIQSVSSVQGSDSKQVIHQVGLSGTGRGVTRQYSRVRDEVKKSINLTPRPHGDLGVFSLPLVVALPMYVGSGSLKSLKLTACSLGVFSASIIIPKPGDINQSRQLLLKARTSENNELVWSDLTPNSFNIPDSTGISELYPFSASIEIMGGAATVLSLQGTIDINNLPLVNTTEIVSSCQAPVGMIPFESDDLKVGDKIQDDYIAENIYSRTDFLQVESLQTGTLTLVTNPSSPPPAQFTLPQDTLSSGFNVQIIKYAAEGGSTISHIFFEGVVTYSLGIGSYLSAATLSIKRIPEINPITGEVNNRESLLTSDNLPSISTGNRTDICFYDTFSQSWMAIPSTFGWLSSIDWGSCLTKELTRNGSYFAVPTAFTAESFTAWKSRAAADFTATAVPNTSATIIGSIAADNPNQIEVPTSNQNTVLVETLTAGDIIYGPGLQEGTIITNSSATALQISPPAIRSGSFTFRVLMRHNNGVSYAPKIFDFKKELLSLYPTLTSSVFKFLWPNKIWPNVSQGNVEGVKDTSLYSYLTELADGVLRPSNKYITRNIFLDLSLDRLLFHPNTLNILNASGQPACLCDLPWLNYIETFAKNVKRASEQVFIGAQLNLSTDISGLYSTIPNVKYSDPSIQSKVITLPQYYTENPVPAFIQLGTGGSGKSKLFVSIDDLTRPTIYGIAFYDQSRITGESEKRRAVYLSSGGTTEATTAAINSTTATLESPIFESPVGEYENLLGPKVLNKGVATYPKGLSSPENPTNTYHAIHSTVYAQKYRGISMLLDAVSTPLRLNSPAIRNLRKLPKDIWKYQGEWAPSTNVITTYINTPPYYVITLDPKWPVGKYQDKDYFIVQQTATIETYSFTKGDWIIWDSLAAMWTHKTWELQGALGIEEPNLYMQIPDISHLSGFEHSFPYFIITSTGIIQNVGLDGLEVAEGDWLIASGGTPENPEWVVADGQCYDILQNVIYKDKLSTSEYNRIIQKISNTLAESIFIYQLPRKFLGPGSCDFQFIINPNYKAIDTNGVLYRLTAAPFLYDENEELFYVEDSDLSDIYVSVGTEAASTNEPFFVQDSPGLGSPPGSAEGVGPLDTPPQAGPGFHENAVQFQAKSSIFPLNHYVSFREPKYYKNVGTVIGEVNPENPTQIFQVPGFSFPINQISTSDILISEVQVELRSPYSTALENTFFNHYINLKGITSTPGAGGIALSPITGTNADGTYLSEFTAAASHLNIGDQVRVAQSALARQYDSSYEMKYYKNLLLVAGQVSPSAPNVLTPIGTSSDDIRAFTDALNILNVGDTTAGVYITGGSSFITNSSYLPFTGNNGSYALSVACNQEDPLLWIAGGVNKQLVKSSNTINWTTISLPAAWPTNAAIRKVYFATMRPGTDGASLGQWRIVGDAGMCAYSLDNGDTWTIDSIPSWTGSIRDISYSSTGWVISGDNGQVSYLPGDLADPLHGVNWTMSALPGSDGEMVTLPPNAPAGAPAQLLSEGWGTTTARAVASGNGVWIVGGGDSVSGQAPRGLLARSTNLQGSPAWMFLYLGENWDNNYVTSLAYGNSTWVVTGISGKIAYSINDGLSWQMGTLPSDWGAANINDVSYDYGIWTIAGDAGKIATSLDGTNWEVASTPTSLGTTNLRSAANGGSSQGIERLVVGDSTLTAYSNSSIQALGSLTVESKTPGTLAVNFDSDITTFSSLTDIPKIVLISFYTQKSIECELVGIPTSRIPLFSINDKIALPAALPTTKFSQANRVYYPHMNPDFDLVVHDPSLSPTEVKARAGYPLYEEDPTQYYSDASGQISTYRNASDHIIYLCNANGDYVNNQYEIIPVSTFINYVNAGKTAFNDSRQLSYSPRYSTYESWISGEGRLLLGNSQSVVNNTVVELSPSYVRFQNPISLQPGNNILILTINPSIITGSVPISNTPQYNNLTTHILDNETTGIYLPDGGYGTWIGYDHTLTTTLPWEGDHSAFYLDQPLYNANGDAVYLCNVDGTYRRDSLNQLIQMKAPVYFTFQELLLEFGQEIELAGCKGRWVPAQETVGGVTLPAYPPSGNLFVGDYYVVTNPFAIGLVVYSQDDIIKWNGSSWELITPSSISVVAVDSVSNILTFSGTLPRTTGKLRLHMLTIASFEPETSSLMDPRKIYHLYQRQLKKYAPDRVSYENSAYPPYASRPDLYFNSTYTNANDSPVFYCNEDGFYINPTNPLVISNLADRVQPLMPKYRLCQDWYKDEQYIPNMPNNPYWQYATLKDFFDVNTKSWSQRVAINYSRKSKRGSQFVQEPITDGSNYISIEQGLQRIVGPNNFEVAPAPFINYAAGTISLLALGNPNYGALPGETLDNTLLRIQSTFEQYGISFLANPDLSTIASGDNITHVSTSSELLANYTVNTTQNFADTQDSKSSLVAITEAGIFNTDGNMIAYATFPPIIYDSSKNHLSLNVFIKQGEFSTI
jgi:hypothetical protein